MSEKSHRKRSGVVYSTNPDFIYQYEEQEEPDTLPKEMQDLRVWKDSRNRAGKTVTLVKGFTGKTKDLEELARLLKTRCGVGGTVKNGEIIIQGDFRDKIIEILHKEGYKAKKAGG